MDAAKALQHRRFRAVAHLLTGTGATVALSLLSIALTARALGPAQYGSLAIILSLAQASERLLSFQSWQPLIRYGARLDADRDRDDIRALYKFGLLLDFAGGAAAWAVSSLLAIASHFVLGVAWSNVGLALIFLISLLFNVNGTATAVFRMSDQFRIIAHIQIFNALLRLAAAGIAFLMGAGLPGFVLIWMATQVSGALLNAIFAMRALHGQGITQIARASIAGIRGRFPDLWGFTWGANFSLTIWASAQQLDTLIVGWLADPASAGMFHIAKRVSRVVQQVGSQVEAVVYPELSREWAAGKRSSFIRLIVQTELMLAAFGAAVFAAALLFGHWVLLVTAGPRFVGAAPLLTVQIIAVSLTISGAASRAGLLSMGRQPAVLRTVLASATTFYCVIAPLIHLLGAMGANIAHVLFGMVWLGGLTLALRKGLLQSAATGGRAVQI